MVRIVSRNPDLFKKDGTLSIWRIARKFRISLNKAYEVKDGVEEVEPVKVEVSRSESEKN